MRENMGLYRGKRTGDGEWVEGYLTYRYRYDQQSRKEILGPVIDCPQEVTLGNTTGKVICSYQVVPGTEGQFTGLKDKNGKRIFEGDILSVYGECIVKVIFADGGFYVENDCTYVPAYHYENAACEVIGNIHDNPELLEVSK